MIGFGAVGSGVVNLFNNMTREIFERVGLSVELVKIAVRNKGKKRSQIFDKNKITEDAFSIVTDPEIDIVVEVMGGEEPAMALILKAISQGKHVVTANKHLLAMRGEEVYSAVESGEVELGFEAAVAGAIPIVRAIRSAFAGDRIDMIQGIVNGTGNYILSRMTSEGKPFNEILKDAQSLGYAESDPAFDIEGIDSAHKVAIMAALAFGTSVNFGSVFIEGITSITPDDISMAREFGLKIKLLATAKRCEGGIEARVHPAMIPQSHFLASVNGAYNAIEIICDNAAKNVLIGPGAGSGPTASAIAGDVIDIACKIARGGAGKTPPMLIPLELRNETKVKAISDMVFEYYLRFTVSDRPGILAKLAGALGEKGISIASMIQRGRQENEPVSVVLTTHSAAEADLDMALEQLKDTDICLAPVTKIRIQKDA
jgi:homoserine dehydrogenase